MWIKRFPNRVSSGGQLELQSASEDEEAEELPHWDKQDEEDEEEEETPEYEKTRVDTLLADNVRRFGRRFYSLHPLMQDNKDGPNHKSTAAVLPMEMEQDSATGIVLWILQQYV